MNDLWANISDLIDALEAQGCRLSAQDNLIKFEGNFLTAHASAILTVLEKYHDDTLVVLANRKHG